MNMLATNMAVKLGRIENGKSLSDKRYNAYLKGWGCCLKVIKPRYLSSTMEASLTQEVIDSDFFDLLFLNRMASKLNLTYII